jgi:hypothetical protein
MNGRFAKIILLSSLVAMGSTVLVGSPGQSNSPNPRQTTKLYGSSGGNTNDSVAAAVRERWVPCFSGEGRNTF